jgi:uncharacterized protein YjiS (DUF1127 family)
MAEARRAQSRYLAAGVLRIGRAIMSLARAAGAAFAKAERRRAVHRILSGMTERELRDIGLNRSDIPAVAAGVWIREAGSETTKVTAIANAGAPRAPSPVPVRETELRKAA